MDDYYLLLNIGYINKQKAIAKKKDTLGYTKSQFNTMRYIITLRIPRKQKYFLNSFKNCMNYDISYTA